MGLFDFLICKHQQRQLHPGTLPCSPSTARLSDPHLLLLSKFLSAWQVDWVPSSWQEVLGESPQEAIDRFVREGLLTTPPLSERLQVAYKADELGRFLKADGLKSDGPKNERAERLATANAQAMEAKLAHLRILKCSEDGRALAESFVEKCAREKNEALAESFNCLHRREYQGASQAVCRFEARQVFPRGIDVPWEHPGVEQSFAQQLGVIFSSRPKILDGLADAEREPLSVAAGMMLLWGSNSASQWLPEGFVGIQRFDSDISARMLIFHAHFRRDLENARAVEARTITISCANDSCPTCKELARTYPLDGIPELPHPNCTHPMGCRCLALPDLPY